jgi:hypothetical protein
VNSERSDLRFEARKPVFDKRDMEVYMIDLYRAGFKTWFFGAWHNGVPLRIWTLREVRSEKRRKTFIKNAVMG